ncbi:phage holin family protein [Nocardia yamanashiensis]|uniref:phage holin family protein n=1 Tax=Nocardia yamanashiensis TaxID=209247 RepID=UPI00082F9958|nr:phage holin family protein [Nocardia yamanashiensis]UGT40158.1 phage holin family protein [Nocardia yamanashiensis]
MSFTQGGNGQDGRRPRTITSIPLSGVDSRQESFGDLVRDASEQMSTLVRAEVELAKAEVTGEIKKGLQGSVYFIAALTVLLFSSFFFFFFLAELLDVWVYRWLAFLIVFLLMIVAVALFGLLGYLKVRKLRAPEKTIESLKEAKTLVPSGFSGHGKHEADAPAQLDTYRN